MIDEEDFRISIQAAEAKLADVLINFWISLGASLEEVRDVCRRLEGEGTNLNSPLIRAVLDALQKAPAHCTTH